MWLELTRLPIETVLKAYSPAVAERLSGDASFKPQLRPPARELLSVQPPCAVSP